MDRLITDSPSNNEEAMLNLAYAENSWVCIRELGKPFLDYIREQCRKHGCNLSELDNRETVYALFDCEFSNPQCPIHLLHTVATQAAELRGRLREYENTELAPYEVIQLKSNADTLTHAANMPTTEICNLVTAYKAGRMVELPKVDDSNYQGLKIKYCVYKAQSGEIINDCFVLRPEKDKAAREALKSYALACENKSLSNDIISWLGRIEGR